MRKTVLILSIIFITASSAAQQVFDKWPEKMFFGDAMAQIAYASEEGNFEPVRSRAKELVEKATAMVTSAEKGAALETSKELQQQAVNLYTIVSGPDSREADIATQMEKLEKTFALLSGVTKSPDKMYSGR